MVQQPQAVFRSDASHDIGGGHVVRCLALANALQTCGWDVRFATSAETTTLFPNLLQQFPGSSNCFSADLLRSAKIEGEFERDIDLIVIDHYGLDVDFERSALCAAGKVLVVSDAPDRRHLCTHLLDSTHGRLAEDYRIHIPVGATALCGAEYALLRPAFAQKRALKPTIAVLNNPPKILISMGLMDSANATAFVLQELLRQPSEAFDVCVVLGRGAPHRKAICELIAQSSPNWRLTAELDEASMAAEMFSSDLIVGAPGSASYERCCLGKPTILLLTADNQASNARALENSDAAVVAGKLGDIRNGDLLRALTEVLSRSGRYASLAANSWKIADGRGAERVASILSS